MDPRDDTSGRASFERIAQLIGITLLGLALIGAGGWVGLQALKAKSAPKDDSYKITQSIDHEVTYADNSFFKTAPAPVTNAYVTQLVEKLTAKFKLDYRATTDANLEYTYFTTASVRAMHQRPSEETQASVVWSKDFDLTEPTTERTQGKTFSIVAPTTIPFREYKALINQFDTALNVGTSGEALITFHVSIKGESDGATFTDSKKSSLVAPLTQSVLNTEPKVEKEATGEIKVDSTAGLQELLRKFFYLAAALIAIVGLALLAYVYRNRVYKSEYQRELEKIYRYHDGIIIHSATVPDLSGKQRVTVEHFSDLLNIEEEQKSPILACRLSNHGTLFLIIRSEVVYQYTLGKPLERNRAKYAAVHEPTHEPETEPTPEVAEDTPPAPVKRSRPAARRIKIQ